MKLFYRALAICTCTLLLCTACAQDPTHGKNPDPAAVTAQLQKDMKFPEMLEVNADKLSKYYTIPDNTVENCSVYLCSSAASADEIAVFRAKSPNDADKIKAAVKDRIDQKAAVFQNYGKPQEYSYIQNCVLESKGKYVFFAVTSDSTKARNTFDGFFK